jgi:hypothetical protein
LSQAPWALAKRQDLLRIIRARFPEAPEGLAERVGRVRSEPVLNRTIERAAVANSLEEVERLLDG